MGTKSATSILAHCAELLAERGKDYDDGEERSMGKVVEMFNVATGHNLSETQGWLFMQLVKIVRQETSKVVHKDSYLDDTSYSALKAESAFKNQNKEKS